MKVVWHKHYLIISFLVGFAHHDKNFNETYQAQKALRGNSFLFNVITNLIWDFFKWKFHFSLMKRLFQDSFIFGETISSYFFKVTTSM